MLSMNTDLDLLRLLQLSSATLPVGGFSFSQGLEYAVEAGWLNDADDVEDWLLTTMQQSLGWVDLPLLLRSHAAWAANDETKICYWNDYAVACRETAELKATDVAMGNALIRLLKTLDVAGIEPALTEHSYVTAFALASSAWHIDTQASCSAYSWSWLENQVAAATKLVPLGQTAAQRLLLLLSEHVPAVVAQSAAVEDDAIGSSLPSLALASGWHETQYCRLFQS